VRLLSGLPALHETPGNELCDRVFRALKGAPIEWVTEGSKRIGLLRRLVRKKYSEFDSYGLSVVVAQGIGKRWREIRIKECQQEQEQHVRTVHRLTEQAAESFRSWYETWQSLNQLARTATGTART